MNTAYKSLIFRLIERDINPDEIPGLMRSVFWIMSGSGQANPSMSCNSREHVMANPDRYMSSTRRARVETGCTGRSGFPLPRKNPAGRIRTARQILLPLQGLIVSKPKELHDK